MRIRYCGRAFLAILAVGLSVGATGADAGGQSVLCGPGPPEEVLPVELSNVPGDVTRISWPSQSAYAIDIVRGSLAMLSTTLGDYQRATEACLANDVVETAFDDSDVPGQGEGYWYLLRTDWGGGAGCPYPQGSYDSQQEGGQIGSTDAEISASGRDCACFFGC